MHTSAFDNDQPISPSASTVVDQSPRFFQLLLILFGIVGIIWAWGSAFHQLGKSRLALLNGLEREQKNLSSVLAENLFQIFEQKQAIERAAINLIRGKQQFVNDIDRYFYSERAFSRVAIFDFSGQLLFQSSPLSWNEHPASQNLEILINQVIEAGKPTIIKSREKPEVSWHLSLLFPVSDGSAKGAMLLELDIGYLLTIIHGIDLGRSGEIVILDNEGDSLAVFESGGLSIRTARPHMPLPPGNATSGTGILRHPGTDERQYAFALVKDFPIAVAVSQEIDDFLDQFYKHKAQMTFALLLLSSFSITFIYLLLRMINRKQEYLRKLSASHTHNRELMAKLAQEHEASVKAASIDTLTGLNNRRLFIYLAQQQLTSARRKRKVYAVLFIDLDRFKTINDTLGHRVGDLLLISVAERLLECTRKSDIVARFGGDEFVILLTEMEDDLNILPILDKIIDSISKSYQDLDGHNVNTSPSIGVAVYPRDGETLETLLTNADTAMYKSKRSGRGKYSFFDASLNRVSLKTFEIEQRLPYALNNSEFLLHYQPKISLNNFCMVGLEALVRWQPPEHQLIFPNDFINVAENAGFIAQLGAWVFDCVCRQLRTWQDSGLRPTPVALNVSSLELQSAEYAKRFLTTLDRYKLSPTLLEIELTESALIEDKSKVITNLQALLDHGVQIALDDFGMGFATLDNIRTLPITTLKIDRSFIKEIRNTHTDSPIVHSTITLAKRLGLTVVAEGVEIHEQVVNLKIAGCDQAQGYLFSRPVEEQVIREHLARPSQRFPL